MSQSRLVLALVCLLAPALGAAAPQAKPAAEPRAVLVLEPDLAAAVAAGASEQQLLARLDQALLKRAEGAAAVRKAAVEHRGGRVELALELKSALDEAALAELAAELATPGVLDIAIVAQAEDGVDLAVEEQRLKDWVAAHPDAPLSAFSAVARDQGGPDPRLRWAERKAEEGARRLPLLVPSDPAWRFGGEDLAKVYPSQDQSGFPALGFELAEARKADFGAFTGAHVDRLMAVAIDGQVVSVATINERLPGRGIIMGRLTNAEVARMVRVLRPAAPLPVPVRVVEVKRG